MTEGVSKTDFKAALAVMAPSIVGMMIARSGTIVATYGSYGATDSGITTDGSSLFALAILLIPMMYFGVKKTIAPKHVVYRVAYVGFAVEGVAIMAMGVFGHLNTGPSLLLSSIVTLASFTNLFYWLRRARNTTSAVAATYVFGALILSEPLIYAASLMPRSAACLLLGALMFLQYPCVRAARKRPLLETLKLLDGRHGYFGIAKRITDSRGLLAVTALGTFLLSLGIGVLRGFPDGLSIAFTPPTRIAYVLLEVALFVYFIATSLRGERVVMTLGVWLVMQLMGCAALFSYILLPENPEIGAVFSTVTNVTMTGFVWYLVIAFETYGSNDPYYYAIAGHAVFLLARSIARLATILVLPVFPNDEIPTAMVGAFILLSAQAVFFGMLIISRNESSEALANASHLRGLLGLEESGKDSTNMRRTLMERNTQQMQKQFMLSDRETEVLTLYALGITQGKIAEQLCIAPGTAHTHIKRIYAKTDLHSRQEILDYIEQYTE